MTIDVSMQAARIHHYGWVDSIVRDRIPIPEPGADEILIRVEAASVNPLDVKLVKGTVHDRFPIALPYVLGTDIVGTVKKVGPLAMRWREGDRVFGRLAPMLGGGFADYAVMPAIDAGAAPIGLEAASLAGIPAACGTAWEGLFELGRLRAGQRVLVHAAAGGVGSFAVQLAKISGAHVIATASGEGLTVAQSLGADQVIDYRNEDFARACGGIDLVLDTIGGETQNRSFAVLKRGGTMVCVTEAADPERAKAAGVATFRLVHQMRGSRLDLMAALVSAGKLKTLVDSTFPFSRVGEAIARNATRAAKGKILVEMTG